MRQSCNLSQFRSRDGVFFLFLFYITSPPPLGSNRQTLCGAVHLLSTWKMPVASCSPSSPCPPLVREGSYFVLLLINTVSKTFHGPPKWFRPQAVSQGPWSSRHVGVNTQDDPTPCLHTQGEPPMPSHQLPWQPRCKDDEGSLGSPPNFSISERSGPHWWQGHVGHLHMSHRKCSPVTKNASHLTNSFRLFSVSLSSPPTLTILPWSWFSSF